MYKRIMAIILAISIIFLLGGCSKVKLDQLAMPEKGETIAIIKTNMGDIYLRLFKKDAPDAVENFTIHAQNGYYDNLIFHRVIKNFMIQGGDPTGTGSGGESIWGSPFPDYFTGNLFHYNGALSMANSGYNTNGSQFFIVQAVPLSSNPDTAKWLESQGFAEEIAQRYLDIGGTPWLDNRHTSPTSGNDGHVVFGQVFKGMDVVEDIANVPVIPANSSPIENVIIFTIKITEYE